MTRRRTNPNARIALRLLRREQAAGERAPRASSCIALGQRLGPERNYARNIAIAARGNAGHPTPA
jgi:hypothetical protein